VGVVIDEIGAVNGGMMISRVKAKNSEKILIACHFIHHKSHLKSPGIKPGSSQMEVSFQAPEHVRRQIPKFPARS
jgi:hypothetical protein